jgi:REP element-mobilizing transposase RayT
MHKYLAGVSGKIGCPPIKINGPADHVHVLFFLGRRISVADFVRDLKCCSSKWARSHFSDFGNFHWQKGYGAFASFYGEIGHVVRYIENQEVHHRKVTFKEEFRSLCFETGVEIDERYVWD